jgi:hypothetical protein
MITYSKGAMRRARAYLLEHSHRDWRNKVHRVDAGRLNSLASKRPSGGCRGEGQMTGRSSEERFREAAEAEDGMPVSAGARIAHIHTAAEAGRIFYVDLSSLPEAERPAVVTEIKELVARAIDRVPAKDLMTAQKPSFGTAER